jgi:hypothetical protein
VKQLSAFYGLLPKNIGCVGDKIVFSIGKKIMVSAGTIAGTIVLKDLSAGTNVWGHFTTWRGEAYFSADDRTHGREPWKTDLEDGPDRQRNDDGGGISIRARRAALQASSPLSTASCTSAQRARRARNCS